MEVWYRGTYWNKGAYAVGALINKDILEGGGGALIGSGALNRIMNLQYSKLVYLNVILFVLQLNECLGNFHKHLQENIDQPYQHPFSLSIQKSSIHHPSAGNGMLFNSKLQTPLLIFKTCFLLLSVAFF